MRRSIFCAERKSSKVNWPLRIRASIAACSSSDAACSARSISVSTSPMPRIRDAMRSGWKTSSASSFSPVEANRIGLSVTDFTESAAPPRASPSSLVRMTPSKSIRSSNATATFTASWPVIESSTSRTFVGFASSRTRDELVHQRLVDLEAAGGVDDHRVDAVLARAREALARRLDRILRVGAVDRDVDLLAELLELVDRGRALEVGGDEAGLAALACAGAARASRRWSSCPSPGGRRAGSPRGVGSASPVALGAHQLGQLLVDDLHDLLAGREALQHLLAERALAHAGDEVADDLRG